MKHLIWLLLVLPLATDAQIYIDSYRFGLPVQAGLVLDSFPGAAAAYSLRLLDADYAGSAIKVRRTSDGDSLDIGFSNNYLDTVGLKNFCLTGATDSCFVRTWYDQSGNGRHARQTDNNWQPKIMINGAILYKGNNVVIQRDSDFVKIPTNIGLANQSIFSVMSLNIAVDQTTAQLSEFVSDTTTVTNLAWYGAVTGTLTDERHVWLSATPSVRGVGQTTTNLSAGRYIWTRMFQTAPTTQVYKNGSLESMTNTIFGAFTSTEYPRSWNFMRDFFVNSSKDISDIEYIVYPSYQSTDRAAIETNINTFYQIY